MTIYDRPTRFLMRDMLADLAREPGQTFTRQTALDWFARRYPKLKSGTINCHLTRLSTNNPTRLHYSAIAREDDVLFQVASGLYRAYDSRTDPPPITTDSPKQASPQGTPVVDDDAGGDDQNLCGNSEFAYEKDLQSFLAKNLQLLEPGLRLFSDDEGTSGIEFDVGGRRIDILAVDRNNNLVIIELKVSRGYDRVVGQLLRYMQWIEDNQADPGQSVRGIIVAREISEDLRLATKRIAGAELFEYELAVKLRKI